MANSGVRSGPDAVRMLALKADDGTLGRSWLYALAGARQAGVIELLTRIGKEMEVAMTLIETGSIHGIDRTVIGEPRGLTARTGAAGVRSR